MPRHIALILAKEGSIGLPGKNTYVLHDTNLLEMTIRELQQEAVFEAIYLSSNGERILQMGESYGARIIRRDNALADNARYVDSVHHAISSMNPSPDTITIPQVVQPIREPGIFRKMINLHSKGVDSVVTVEPFESSVSWIYRKNSNNQKLEQCNQVHYHDVTARESDLCIIDNAIVSFTYDSWKRSDGFTSWPYLGRHIIGVEQHYLNKHYRVDINSGEDAEWLEFITEFKAWWQSRKKCSKTA